MADKVILPKGLYERAEAAGYDLRLYLKEQPIPAVPGRLFIETPPAVKHPHYEKFRYARPR